MRPSTAERAAADPYHHSVDTEGRYWEHAEAAPRGPYARVTLAVPHPPPDGSIHALRSPMGAEALFTWRGDVGWMPRAPMRRMAYSPDHLGSLGWTYLRLIDGDAPADELKPLRAPRRSKQE